MSTNPQAEQKKNEGNVALGAKDYPTAIQHYTEGIEIDPSYHILYSNRAAAYQDSAMFAEALEDANKVIELAPTFWKGYSRKGLALLSVGNAYEALEAYQQGLNYAPNEQSLHQGIASAQQQINAEQQNSQNMIVNMMLVHFQGDVKAKASAFPECAEFAGSPEFLNKVEAIKANPNMIMEYIQDEQISAYISASLQYSTPGKETPVSKEDVAKKRMEQQEQQLKRQEEERLRKKEYAKKREEAEKKRKEEERVASMSSEQLQAEEIKNEANALFKSKDFDAAVAKYHEAFALDPTNMVYLSNVGAVYFAQNKLEECITICTEALEIGYKNFCDLTHKARALTRIGNCYFKLEDYSTAIEYYNKSLLEAPDRHVSQQIRKADKALREKSKQDYINPELSEQARLEGNEFFKAQKYPEAIKSYEEAIKRNPTNPIPYSNRATALTKLGAYREAIKDCDSCIELDPSFVKAYIKKAHAYFIMEDFSQCLTIYDQALVYEPDNEEVKQGIQKTIFRINSTTRDEETVRKNIENNPEIQEILRDPGMSQVLNDLQNDRQAAARHLSNPDIKKKIDKLIAAGVIQ